MLKVIVLKFLITLVFLSSAFAQRTIDNCCEGIISFIENKNQWEPHIRYKVELSSTAVFLENKGVTFFFEDRRAVDRIMQYKLAPPEKKERLGKPSLVIDYHAYRMDFKGANDNVITTAYNPSSDYINYYIGNDRSRWASGVRRYDKVHYHELYNHIDLIFYEEGQYLKYDFVVKPGGNPNDIALVYTGQDDLNISYRGHLNIQNSFNRVTELKPFSYQIIDNDTVEVPSRFILKDNTVKFSLPRGYNKDYELIIDPVLVFSTYTGSTTDNWGYTATYDYEGFVYTAGISMGLGYPFTTGAFQQTFGGPYCDISITKFDTTGSSLIYSTHLGGNGPEIPHSIFVNNNNELFVFGTTGSSDFPVTPNAYDTTFNGGTPYIMTHAIDYSNGSDIIVTRFNADGTALLASTYLGGTSNDGLSTASPLRYNYADEARGEVFLDNNNNCWIVSSTQSADFPVTSGAFQSTFGGGLQDGLIVKLDNELSTIIWSSFIGGSGNDAVYSITMDNDEGHIYVAGGTSSNNFPTTANALNPTFQGGSCDGFIAKIHKNGHSILYATYFGSDEYDQIYFVERDKEGYIYVFGQTEATGNTFIQNALWSMPNGGQFISKLGSHLDTVIWSTAFGTGGGVPNISPTAFLVDLCNNIYLSGWGGAVNGFGGTSGLPVSANAFQSTTNNNDFYLLVITDDASSLVYATYFGGAISNDHVDGGTSRFDKRGVIYQSMCAGCGGHSDTPTTPGAWSQTNNSHNCNNAVFKMDFGIPVTIADFNVPPILCAPATITFNNTSTTSGAGVNVFWDFGDANNSTDYNPTHTYLNSGIYSVMLAVTDTGACNYTDTIVKQIVVLSNTVDTLPNDTICFGDFTQIGIPPLPDPNTTYQWTPATGLSHTGVPNPIASPLSTTNYMLLVDNGVCVDSLFKKVVVDDLTVFAGNDTTMCAGDNITLTAQANQNVKYFLWSSNPQFTDTLNAFPASPNYSFNPVSDGFYYVKVANNNCTAIDSVKVRISHVDISTQTPVKICLGDTTQLSVSNLNPTNPLTYAWSPLQQIISGATTNQPTVSPQQNTTFIVTVTDTLGCMATMQVVVDVVELFAGATIDDDPCYQQCSGSINVTASGGDAPYAYLWSNGQMTQTAINLCAGSYSVSITDANNCSVVETYTVNEPPQLLVTVVDTTHVSCNGICDGEITVAALGGTPPYSYSWISGPTTPTITGLCAGTYTVTVTDDNNCVENQSVIIQDTSTLDVTVQQEPATCFGYCDGTAELIPSGGTPPYTYQWHTGYTGSHHNNLCAGTYSITVSDSEGCLRNVYAIIEEPYDIMVDVAIISHPSCHNYCDGEVFVAIGGGTEPYSVVWSNGSSGYHVDDLCSGYSVFTITDAQGCVFIDSVYLENPLPILLDISATNVPCEEVCNATAIVTASGEFPPFTYLWHDGQVNDTAVGLCYGNNYVTVTDSLNCTEQISIFVNDSSVVPPDFMIYAENDTIFYGQTTQIWATELDNYTYLWHPFTGLNNPYVHNPRASPKETTTYILTYTDPWGCVYRDTITIYVAEIICDESNVFVPNAFSPNDDNYNDVLYVRGVVIDEIYFAVFNRWGEKVFETRSMQKGWDGTYKGRMSEPGVYVYYLEVVCVDEQEFRTQGNVTLLR